MTPPLHPPDDTALSVVEDTGGHFVVRCGLSSRITLDSPTRTANLLARTKKLMRRLGGRDFDRGPAHIEARFDERHSADKALERLHGFVEQAGKDRVSPKIVEEALAISGIERIRWTKLGRLPRSGMGSFTSGITNVHFWLYAAAGIWELKQQPGLVASWRASDGLGRDGNSVRNLSQPIDRISTEGH